ncbi:hypothetical protein POV27_02415 [Aureisphaera galaxeae]|uniref:aldose 1-epimerase n=1 Tax=Aureisphaera galaxeae TaxID=1538023 RepID=UPI00235085F6|nr:hypothetical protein [Aureisphaera galaxeae]MDC8002896.1 hypothetical protein [Aureisphaera galaxeae]
MTHHFISHPNPKLSHYVFESAKASYKVFPHLGGSVLDWVHDGTQIMTPFPLSEEGIAYYEKFYPSSLLFPFPNRLEDGTFRHEDISYTLPINDPDGNNAIHGCVSNCSFSVSSVTDTQIHLDYDHNPNGSFPFAFKMEVSYAFSEKGMTLSFHVINLGNKSFPFGLGWHPYFTMEDKHSEILFASNKTYHTNGRMIPTDAKDIVRNSITLNNKELDTAFNLLQPEVRLKTKEYDLSITTQGLEYLQLFIPDDRKSIAIEPMTCIANSFNNGVGKQILHPQSSFKCSLHLQLEHGNT